MIVTGWPKKAGAMLCIAWTMPSQESVHLSVIRWYSVETDKHIIKLFIMIYFKSGSIIMSHHSSFSVSKGIVINIPTETPTGSSGPIRGRRMQEYEKITIFGEDFA